MLTMEENVSVRLRFDMKSKNNISRGPSARPTNTLGASPLELLMAAALPIWPAARPPLTAKYLADTDDASGNALATAFKSATPITTCAPTTPALLMLLLPSLSITIRAPVWGVCLWVWVSK